MSHKIIVFSCDAMVWEDVENLLKNDARFSEFFQHGSMVKRMRTIYPSITYALQRERCSCLISLVPIVTRFYLHCLPKP